MEAILSAKTVLSVLMTTVSKLTELVEGSISIRYANK